MHLYTSVAHGHSVANWNGNRLGFSAIAGVDGNLAACEGSHAQ